jgi:chromosome partitioning protein
MALTIAVSSLKGGVGKSTIALNLATCLHRAGHRAIVVDTDPQGTCRMWAAKAAEVEHEGPPVVAMDGKTLRRDLERVSKGFDVAVIDCPPRMGAETRAAMLASDLVVMPVIPGAADVWALQETIAVLDEAKQYRDELRAVVVLNRADRTTLAKLALQALSELEVRVLDEVIKNRVAYGEATLAGLGVVDYAPESDAALEVKRFSKAVLAAVKKAA